MPETETSAVVDAPPARRPPPESAEGIFLSPRVVDEATFNDFAAALRDLVGRAEEHVEPLKTSTAQAERTLAAIKESAGRQQARLDLALKTLAAIEERSLAVERSLQRAAELTSALNRFSDQAEHMVNTRLSEFATRVQAEAQSAAARIALLEERLARAEADLDRKVSRVIEMLGLGSDDGGAAKVDLPGLVKRGEALRAEAAAAAEELASIKRQAEEARALLAGSVDAAAARAAELRAQHESIEGAIRESVAMCREADEALRTREASVRAALDVPMQELRTRAEEATETLRMTVEQSERACELGYQVLSRQVEAVTELRTLLSQLEPWRGIVAGGEGGEGELPRPLVEIVETVRARVAAELSGLTAALASLAQGAEAATRAIGAPTPRSS